MKHPGDVSLSISPCLSWILASNPVISPCAVPDPCSLPQTAWGTLPASGTEEASYRILLGDPSGQVTALVILIKYGLPVLRLKSETGNPSMYCLYPLDCASQLETLLHPGISAISCEAFFRDLFVSGSMIALKSVFAAVVS